MTTTTSADISTMTLSNPPSVPLLLSTVPIPMPFPSHNPSNKSQPIQSCSYTIELSLSISIVVSVSLAVVSSISSAILYRSRKAMAKLLSQYQENTVPLRPRSVSFSSSPIQNPSHGPAIMASLSNPFDDHTFHSVLSKTSL